MWRLVLLKFTNEKFIDFCNLLMYNICKITHMYVCVCVSVHLNYPFMPCTRHVGQGC